MDGLRAVAVLSVIGYHAFPSWIKGGFVGVDIFFVISGFLISGMILGNLEKERFSFSEFYTRRIKRIFPALALVLAATFAFGWYVMVGGEFGQLGKHVAASAGFASNFALWSEHGYFDNASQTKPLLHVWSLGIEEQFYILWPVLLGVAYRLRLNVLLLMAGAACGSFALAILTVGEDAVAAFYSPLCRFWELMIGGMLACVYLRRSHRPGSFANAQALAGLLLIGTAIFAFTDAIELPGWRGLLPTLGAFLVISASPNSVLNRYALGNRFMVRVGLISYPLYLWHWPLVSFAHIIEYGKPSLELRAASVIASFALAWITYALLEKPARASEGAAGRRWVTALVLSVGLLLGIGVLAQQEIWKPRHGGTDVELLLKAVGDWEYPKGLAELRVNGVRFYEKRASDSTVLFIGDSHVEQYGPRALQLIGDDARRNRSVIFATAGGCPPVPHVFEDKHTECEKWRAEAFKLAHRDDVKAVVIGAAWNAYFTWRTRPGTAGDLYDYYYIENGVKVPFRAGRGAALALASLERFIKSLARDKTVFLLLDNPGGPQFNPKAYIQGSRLTSVRARSLARFSKFDDKQSELRQELIKIAQRTGATVIDPVLHLCKAGHCAGSLDDGTPIYKDDSHLRPLFVRKFADFIDVAIKLPAPR